MNNQIQYVLGFMFNQERDSVLLIHKEKPDWQRGLKNGIGGKLLDQYEAPLDAMCREFEEETGISTEGQDWSPVVAMGKKDWKVWVFACANDIVYQGVTMETERVELCECGDIQEDDKVITNLRWLIPLALDVLDGNVTYDVNNTATL